jgi:hypothetical protein
MCLILFAPTALWLLWIIRDTLNHQMKQINRHKHVAPVVLAPSLISAPSGHAHSLQPPRKLALFNGTSDLGAPGLSIDNDEGGTRQNDTVRQLRRALCEYDFISTGVIE